MPAVDPAALEDMVYKAAKAAFTSVREEHPDQHFYAFALFTDDSLQFLSPVANSEEALTATVRKYNESVDPKYGCTSTRAGMRWSYGDWGYFPDVGGDHFSGIMQILSARFDRLIANEDESDDLAILWPAVLSGFKRLESECFFGVGPARSAVTLLVVGDLPSELVDEWVAELNPPDVVDQYRNWDCNA